MCKKIDYDKLYEVLSDYNAKINLTAIESYEDFMIKHVADSRLGLPYVSGRVLDIGSGAGFPALVLKNEKPELDMTMLDSVGKKVKYLDYVIDLFGLEKTRAVHARIEDLPDKGKFDTVTARAVAKLAVLAEYALPFVKVGGAFVAYKSADCEDEINAAKGAIKILGGRIEKADEVVLTPEIARRMIVVRKIAPTPKGYPRSGNKPRLAPLTDGGGQRGK